MPVFNMVNALARSLGLDSDASGTRKAAKAAADSLLITRNSSGGSDTTAVDASEQVLEAAATKLGCVQVLVKDELATETTTVFTETDNSQQAVSPAEGGDDQADIDAKSTVDSLKQDGDKPANTSTLAEVASITSQDVRELPARQAQQEYTPTHVPATNQLIVQETASDGTNIRARRGIINTLGIAPATYADATNLASQYPDLAEQILTLPLSPVGSGAIVDEVQSSTDTNIGQDTTQPEADVSPVRPVTMHEVKKHTPSAPNWAMAPDEETQVTSPAQQRGREGDARNPNRRRRGKQRGRTERQQVGDSHQSARNSSTTRRKTSPVASNSAGPVSTKVTPRRKKADSRSRTSSPRKARTPVRQLAESALPTMPNSESTQTILAPSPTYICVIGGPPVVVPAGQAPWAGNATSSTPTVADVDALIRELQNARGLGHTNSPGPEPVNPFVDNTANVRGRGRAWSRAPPVNNPPAPGITGELESAMELATEQKARQVWLASHDGVLRPDLAPHAEGSRPRSRAQSRVRSRASSPTRNVPSPLRQMVRKQVDEVLQANNDRSMASTPQSEPESERSVEHAAPAGRKRETTVERIKRMRADAPDFVPASRKGTPSPAPSAGSDDLKPVVNLPTPSKIMAKDKQASSGSSSSSVEMPENPLVASAGMAAPSPSLGRTPKQEYLMPTEYNFVPQEGRWPTLEEMCVMQARFKAQKLRDVSSSTPGPSS